MAQIFHRSTNTISKVSIFGAVFFVALSVLADVAHEDEVRRPRHQPIGALATSHPLTGLAPHGVRRAGRIDANEIAALLRHPL